MDLAWKNHQIKITGNWTGRWLFLAPDYELWIDDTKLDRRGGPRLNPKLEAIVEDEDGTLHHIAADIISVAGFRPSCQVTVEGEEIASGKIKVQNILNPFLVIFIMVASVTMLYIGPEVLGGYF